VLKRLSCTAKAERWSGYMLRILVALAVALEAAGSALQATEMLERALRLGEPGGYMRTFLDEGVPIQRLLSQLVMRNRASAYAHRLLAALRDNAQAGLHTGIALADPLSERELTVLRLLANGLSSLAVANELVVAVSTVRTHIKHIYVKLDAHTRSEAIERARLLGLI
jgi:LuxR family maltose regulon positive regulatory protein